MRKSYIWMLSVFIILIGLVFFSYSNLRKKISHKDRAPTSLEALGTMEDHGPDHESIDPILSQMAVMGTQAVESLEHGQRKLFFDEARNGNGPEILNDSHQVKLLRTVRAVFEGNYAKQGKLLGKSGGFAFFELGPYSSSHESYAVAIDSQNGNLGVLSGIVMVKYAEPNGRDIIASEFNLELIQSFDNLKIAYFKANRASAEELGKLVLTMRADRRVIKADLEILDKKVGRN